MAYFGGNFGIIYERPEQLSNRVELFHLEEWLENHIRELAKETVKCRTSRPWKYSPGAWNHPLDPYFNKVTIPAEIRSAIEQQKIEKAREAVESDRANAIELAIAQLDCKYTKAEILSKYVSQIQVKKSWSKEQILKVLCTQEFAEDLLEIKIK